MKKRSKKPSSPKGSAKRSATKNRGGRPAGTTSIPPADSLSPKYGHAIVLGEVTFEADSMKRWLRKVLDDLGKQESWNNDDVENRASIQHWSAKDITEKSSGQSANKQLQLQNALLRITPPCFGICDDTEPWKHSMLDWIILWLETSRNYPDGDPPRFAVVCTRGQGHYRVEIANEVQKRICGLLVHCTRLGTACLRALVEKGPQGIRLDGRSKGDFQVVGADILKSLSEMTGFESAPKDAVYRFAQLLPIFPGVSRFSAMREIPFNEVCREAAGKGQILTESEKVTCGRFAVRLNARYKGKLHITGIPNWIASRTS